MKNRQIELLAKENFELLKEIEILNETMAALPTRLEADIVSIPVIVLIAGNISNEKRTKVKLLMSTENVRWAVRLAVDVEDAI